MAFLVYGSGASVHQADALAGFAGSPETATCRLVTSPFAPVGLDGETVFRRLFMNVRHKQGMSMFVTPIVDSVEYPSLKQFFSRPVPPGGREERWSFMLPMAVDRGKYTTGLRGTILQVKVEVSSPPADWYLESASIAHNPINLARGREDTD